MNFEALIQENNLALRIQFNFTSQIVRLTSQSNYYDFI
jgi:hypothetical protein